MHLIKGIAILLVVIISFVVFMNYRTSQLSDELMAVFERLHETVEQENWLRADHEVKKLQEQWEQVSSWWTPLMDHREIDDLDQTVTRIVKLVTLRVREDTLVEIYLARRMSRRILEKESPRLENIF